MVYTLTFQNYFLMFIFLNYRQCMYSVTRGPTLVSPTDLDTTADNDYGNMACCVFKGRIQNQKCFWSKIIALKRNYFIL